MTRALVVVLAACLLSACGGAPAGVPGSAGYPGAGAPAPGAAAAVKAAKDAIAQYDRRAYELERATAAHRPALQAEIEGETRQALQAIYALVATATTTSPPAVVEAYRVAKDALNSNNSPDVAVRLAYNVGALKKIAAL